MCPKYKKAVYISGHRASASLSHMLVVNCQASGQGDVKDTEGDLH